MPWLLPCENTIVDLKTGLGIPGNPGDYLRTAAPTAYKGLMEEAPRWNKFLMEVFNNDVDLAKFVHRLLGSTLVGLNIDHKLPIFWGEGRNGKSTLMEIIKHVLGPLAGPIRAEALLEQISKKSGSSPDANIVGLRGKRLVWASETSEGRSFNSGLVKQLTGGDTLIARGVYEKKNTEFEPTHNLFLLTNHKPKANADDYALWSRFMVIPFKTKFIENPAAPDDRVRHLM